MDVAPEPDGTEHNPFYEQLLFEPIGTVTNAEQQTLAALRYHQVVLRKSNDKVFHNETGYWLWDAASNRGPPIRKTRRRRRIGPDPTESVGWTQTRLVGYQSSAV